MCGPYRAVKTVGADSISARELGHVEVSRTPDGKIDPTQIVDPAVAGDWEEQGCKG